MQDKRRLVLLIVKDRCHLRLPVDIRGRGLLGNVREGVPDQRLEGAGAGTSTAAAVARVGLGLLEESALAVVQELIGPLVEFQDLRSVHDGR